MPDKYVARCIGRRHVEVSKLDGGKILIEVKWKETETLCGLVFEPEEAVKLRAALNEVTAR